MGTEPFWEGSVPIMRNGKRWFDLIHAKKYRICISLLLALVLGACSVSTAPPSVDASSISMLPSPPPTDDVSELRQCSGSSGQGFYTVEGFFRSGASITYIDYAAREELFLCASPNCTHTDDGCTSFLPLDASLASPDAFVAGGKLLLLQTGTSETQPPHIEARELNGTGAVRLAEFPANYFVHPSPHIYTDDAALYLIAEETLAENTQLLSHLIRVDLASGESRVLYTFAEGLHPDIKGAAGRALLLAEFNGSDRVEISAFDVDREMRNETPVWVWDAAATGIGLQGQTLCLSDYADQSLRMTDLVTGEVTQLDWSGMQREHPGCQAGFMPFPGPYLRFVFPDIQPGETVFYEDIMDSRDGSWWPFSMQQSYTGHDIPILDVIPSEEGDLLLVRTDYEDAYVLDEGQQRMELIAPQYALIRLEDFVHSTPSFQPIHSQIYQTAG